MAKGERPELGQEAAGEQLAPEINDAMRIMRGIASEKSSITQIFGTEEEKAKIDAGFKEAAEIRRMMTDLQSGDVERSQVYLINRAIEVAREELGDDTLKDIDIIPQEIDQRMKESGEYLIRLQNLRDHKEKEYQNTKEKVKTKDDEEKVRGLEKLLQDISHNLITGKADLSRMYSKTRELLSAIRGLDKIREGKETA